ncbi:hypothetical protein [Pseudarthrobacter sp. SSS035]|uniref:hypothetical protein n=1 Tax=Pseudarthrobacter sp. SSS035 TaxID=2931399 RepID=UPI003531108C
MVTDLTGDDEAGALRAAFSRLICGGDDVSEATAQVLKVLGSSASAGPFVRELSTAVELGAFYPGDPGVLISLLLNRVTLAPGEAVYLPAGNVHAYLSGLGVEVMASSDNVLRGGLTPKYIDVPELTKTIEFAALGIPRIEAASSDLGQELYQPPFQEFQLQRIELATGAAPVPLQLGRGESAFIPASENPVMVHPVAGAEEPSPSP